MFKHCWNQAEYQVLLSSKHIVYVHEVIEKPIIHIFKWFPNYPAILIVLYCSLLFYCPYYTKVITIKIPKYLTGCFLLLPNWGVSFIFKFLLQPACFLLLFHWGIFPYFRILLQLACFLLLPYWGIFPYFGNLLQPARFLLLPYWGIFPYFGNLLQPACFLLLFNWWIFLYFALVNKFWTRNIKK